MARGACFANCAGQLSRNISHSTLLLFVLPFHILRSCKSRARNLPFRWESVLANLAGRLFANRAGPLSRNISQNASLSFIFTISYIAKLQVQSANFAVSMGVSFGQFRWAVSLLLIGF